MKIIIVGGVAGGATLATRLRRLSEIDEIIIFEKTNYVSFANCGLPYYIGDIITDKRELTLQTPQSFKARFNKILISISDGTYIGKSSETIETIIERHKNENNFKNIGHVRHLNTQKI